VTVVESMSDGELEDTPGSIVCVIETDSKPPKSACT
jgi:hypothetical protein